MSVHEFYIYTLEQVKITEWSKKIGILIGKIAMIGCCKLSLYGNDSCDEHAIYFRRGENDVPYVNHFYDICQ